MITKGLHLSITFGKTKERVVPLQKCLLLAFFQTAWFNKAVWTNFHETSLSMNRLTGYRGSLNSAVCLQVLCIV